LICNCGRGELEANMLCVCMPVMAELLSCGFHKIVRFVRCTKSEQERGS
jgi:hypothetical protein